MATLNYDIAGDQIDGARDYQEDTFLVTHLSNDEENQQVLIVVADGMGGHAAGNVASNMAVQTFNKNISSNHPFESTDLLPDILQASIKKSNESLTETIKETAALSGMGCTVVGVVIADGKLWWGSVGDSHLYLLRDKKLHKLNADHSYGGFLNRMAEEGKYVEPDPTLSKNMLMSALTGGDISEIDISNEPLVLQPGDSLLVCSDGLDTLISSDIIKHCGWAPDAKGATEALLKAVVDAERPRQDNTTVVNIRVALAESKHVIAPHDYGDDDDEHSESKGSIGKITGVIGVLAAIGIGGFYFMQPKQQPTTAKPPISSEVVEAPDATDAAEPEVATDAEQPSDVVTTPEPKPKKAPAPAQVVAKPHVIQPFSDKFKSGNARGPVMLTIPAGEFMMGASSLSSKLNERPQHKVTMPEFAISQYEITYAQYEAFAKAEGRPSPDRSGLNPSTHPVVNVSWLDAQEYAVWLSNITGKKYTLPTEAQWEYAARAGTTTSFWWGYKVGNGNAHCQGCGSPASVRRTTAIGSFAANPWGLHDTTGNASEWTLDCYNPNYDGAPADGAAWQSGDCSQRIVRGGSHINAGNSSTNTERKARKARSKLSHIGFRVVREK